MCATHNERSILHAYTKNTYDITFAQLMGMRDDLSHQSAKRGYTTYKYIPFGPFLETVPYLIRRAYEHIHTYKFGING